MKPGQYMKAFFHKGELWVTTEDCQRAVHSTRVEMGKEILHLREALKWYADPINWKGVGPQHDPEPADAYKDKGELARFALTKEF